jgi:hypothetical protein
VYATGETRGGSDVPGRWDDNGDGVAEAHVVDFTYAPLRRRRRPPPTASSPS